MWDGLLRGDYASRMSGYATARQNGWMSANDIRELENLDRISDEEGGNLYLVNGSMTKLSDAGAFLLKRIMKRRKIQMAKRFWNWKNHTEENETVQRVLELNGTIAEESWFDDDRDSRICHRLQKSL